jgi:uncharacterized membrane protein
VCASQNGQGLLYCATVLASIDYRWWVFIHLVGVFGFLLAHGASVSGLFRLRKERDREKIRQLIQFSGSTVRFFYVSLLVLVLGGVGAGLQNKAYWFHQQWIWEAIVVLVLVTVLMFVIARPYYRRVAEATELRPSGVPRVSDEDLALRLKSATPVVVALLGFGGLAVILWLMIFKPM